MPDLRQFDFLLIRYVPDAVKDEFVNIGVVLLDSAFVGLRFTRDWRRARCLDPALDEEMLLALESELRERLRAGGSDRERILHLLRDSFSNTVQISPPKGCLTDSPEQELTRLAEMYLETRRLPATARDTAGRGLIVRKMRTAFEQAGVWQAMMKKFAVAEFTHPGDPLKLDCGYRPNGVLKFFHAVPLAAGADAAKALAFSYPQIREGMARQKQLDTQLTAIIEEHLDRRDDATAFALATLERSQIAVAPTTDLPRLADIARRELRL